MRTLLFVPGTSRRKLEHAAESTADALVLDWEDSVLPGQKQEARNHCLALKPLLPPKSAVFIRVNSLSSPWFPDDIKAVVHIGPDGIVLPKCQSAQDIRELIDAVEREGIHRKISIFPIIESPTGLLRIEEIAKASDQVSGLSFGAHDFCSSMGIRLTQGEPELLMARCAIVTVARARELAAIDSPSLGLHDLDAVRDDANRSVGLGFTGKFAIHPRHLRPIAEAFTPTPEEVKEAEEILQEASNREAGAFAWNGRMVDEALLKKARHILARARTTIQP